MSGALRTVPAAAGAATARCAATRSRRNPGRPGADSWRRARGRGCSGTRAYHREWRSGQRRAPWRLGRQDVAVLLGIVQDPAGPPYHARHGVLVEVNRQSGLLLQQQVEPADQRPAAGHHDAAVHDVAGELRRSDLEGATHGIHDLLDRLLDRLADLARVDPYDLRNARDEVSTLDLHLALLTHGGRGADLDLDLLGRRLADQEVVVLAHELDDRLIQLVPRGPDRRIGHDPRQRDHRDFGGPATDVDHHVAGRRLDGQAHPDGR